VVSCEKYRREEDRREKIEQKITKEAKKKKEDRRKEYKTNGAMYRTPLN
jgi:hypothetical protein